MPTYDYQCRSCGSTTEVIHSMLEDGPAVCERCGGELRRILYPTGIIFKGSGFYKTDSRSSSSATGSRGASSGGASETAPTSEPKATTGGDATPSSDATPSGDAPKKSAE